MIRANGSANRCYVSCDYVALAQSINDDGVFTSDWFHDTGRPNRPNARSHNA